MDGGNWGGEGGRNHCTPLLSPAGAGSPPSSQPHSTPRRGPLLPHGHNAGEGGGLERALFGGGGGAHNVDLLHPTAPQPPADITEELAQKLMRRRALNGGQ